MADEKLYRTQPRERYLHDTEFRYLVDHFRAMIHRAQFSPSELREAAILAAIMYEETKATSYRINESGHIEPLKGSAMASEAKAVVCDECVRLRAKNRNMRRALRDLNKSIRGRADAIRSVQFVNGVARADELLANWGKVTERNKELAGALGMPSHPTWPEMLTKLRSDLAAAQQLGDAERAVVEAAEAWQQNDTYSSRRGEYECRLDVAVSTMQDARRLLALRAAAGKGQA